MDATADSVISSSLSPDSDLQIVLPPNEQSSPVSENDFSGVDSDVDLEATTVSVGTEWADAVGDTTDKISDQVSESSSDVTDTSWTTVVSRQSNSVAAANTSNSNTATDFVIPHNEGLSPQSQQKRSVPV